ncbi:MAG: HYR domain-containing protein, partial [Bacteroidota bacterium]|nr:HYR domain-containing protein [Bacteroidota bacterium]
SMAGVILSKGANLITWTAYDNSGNTNTWSLTITVVDAQAPTINGTAASGNRNTDAGACTYTVKDGEFNPTAVNDNCGITKITYKINSGAEVGTNATTSMAGIVLSKGANLITWTAYDNSGNTNTWSFTITVVDTEKPVIYNCPGNITKVNDPGTCGAAVTWAEPTATDNCTSVSNLIWTKSNTPGSAFPVGITHVTYIVADAAGNQSNTCGFDVIVQDKSAPVFTYTITGTQLKNTDNNLCTYSPVDNSWDDQAKDNCAISSLTYSLSGATTGTGTSLKGLAFNKGNTAVTWIAVDAAGNFSTSSFIVTVSDKQNPSAICKASSVQLDRTGNTAVLPSAIDNNSSDNCGPLTYLISKDNLTFSSSLQYNCSDLGNKTVYLKVTDGSGNYSVCSSTLSVEDKQGPMLDVLSAKSVSTAIGVCTYTHSGTTWDVTDNCDPNPVKTFTLSGATTSITKSNTSLDGQVFNKGTTVVTWNATDAKGNHSVTIFNVVVSDNQKPTILPPANIIHIVASAGDQNATISGIAAPVFADNCGVTKLTWAMSGATVSAPQSSGINILSSGVFNLGTTQVTYVAYDADGNFETCSFTIKILGQEGAIIVSKNSITTTESAGQDSFTVRLGSAPTGTVVIAVSSSNIGEGNVLPSRLIFNASNWNVLQTVTATGVDDNITDGNISYTDTLKINKTL